LRILASGAALRDHRRFSRWRLPNDQEILYSGRRHFDRAHDGLRVAGQSGMEKNATAPIVRQSFGRLM
jgi:hypothetical protein